MNSHMLKKVNSRTDMCVEDSSEQAKADALSATTEEAVIQTAVLATSVQIEDTVAQKTAMSAQEETTVELTYTSGDAPADSACTEIKDAYDCHQDACCKGILGKRLQLPQQPT